MSGTLPCDQPPDPCKELLQQILEFIANLQKRYWDLKNDVGNLPQTKPENPDPHYQYRSIEGEKHQYDGRRQGLQNRLDDWNKNGCGPPPPGAYEWAYRKAPDADPKPSVGGDNTARLVGGGAAAVGTGYVIYRIVRMLPSLFPPLWETIPVNLAVP